MSKVNCSDYIVKYLRSYCISCSSCELFYLHLYADFHVICSFSKEDAFRATKPEENTEGLLQIAVAFVSISIFILLASVFFVQG